MLFALIAKCKQKQKADLEVASARLQSLDRVASSDVAKGLVSTAPSGTLKP